MTYIPGKWTTNWRWRHDQEVEVNQPPLKRCQLLSALSRPPCWHTSWRRLFCFPFALPGTPNNHHNLFMAKLPNIYLVPCRKPLFQWLWEFQNPQNEDVLWAVEAVMAFWIGDLPSIIGANRLHLITCIIDLEPYHLCKGKVWRPEKRTTNCREMVGKRARGGAWIIQKKARLEDLASTRIEKEATCTIFKFRNQPVYYGQASTEIRTECARASRTGA